MRTISRTVAGALALGAALIPISAQAFDAGGFAGGILGGMIGSAIIRAQPRSVVIYRPRRAYRFAPRRVFARRPVIQHARVVSAPAARRAAPAAGAAVVDRSADPFATARPSGPRPIPVANKP